MISARDGASAVRGQRVTPDKTGWSRHHFSSSCEQAVLIRGLAEAFLAGPWDLESLVDRGGRALGRRYRWIRPLARRILTAFPAGPRTRTMRLAQFLRADDRFRRAYKTQPLELHIVRWPGRTMAPAPGAPELWPVPSITSPTELATFLELEPSELDWFADCQTRERLGLSEPLRHYRYRWVGKASSGSCRLIEAPKPRLKQLQRRLLDEILLHIPPHEAAHIALEEGFSVQHRKTRVMRLGGRQRVAGVVINQKTNVSRDDYDQLKAILYNCVRHGPGAQNRAGVTDFRAHLRGRIAYVRRLNLESGERLRRLFERIEW